MLTLFSTPKPFHNHIKIIQTNAIRSWSYLNPQPEIILIGNEEGIEDISKELKLRHIPEVERNEYGTPLLNSVFDIGQANATYPVVGYVNADIILMNEFIEAVKMVQDMKIFPFVISGHRFNLNINEYIKFNNNWEEELKNKVRKNSSISPSDAIDYFIFPKGFYRNLLPFAIGRKRWDNWLIYYAVSNNAYLFDTTYVNKVIHQNHNYANIGKINSEIIYNEQLFGRKGKKFRFCVYTLMDSSYVLTKNGIKKASIFRKLDAKIDRLLAYTVLTLKPFMPFSYPIIAICRSVEILRQLIMNAILK